MRIFIISLVLAVTTLAMPAISFAATCDPNIPGIQCPLEGDTFTDPSFITNLINTISNWMFTFLLALAVLFIVIAAYKYMFSQGSEESVATAHKMLLYAAVAVAVALLSRGIVVVVRSLIGSSTNAPAVAGAPGTGTGTPPVAATPIQNSLRIFDDSGVEVTPAMLPAASISIYKCTLSSGIKWTPAFKFIGVSNVTRLQGGCYDCMGEATQARYGGFESYQVSTGVQLDMERCEDGTSPRFLYNGQSFGGTP